MTVNSEGISVLEDRMRGAQDVLQPKGINWEVVVTGIKPNKAAEITTETLQSNPQIRAVLCTGQADTERAGLAIENNCAACDFFVAGFDLSPEILRMIKAGIIAFSIDQRPHIQGFYPVVQLAHYRRYGIKPSNIDAGAAFVMRDRVDEILKLTSEDYG